MDKFAGLASLFDPSVGTGNAALDEMMGVRPYTQAERDEEDLDSKIASKAKCSVCNIL